uniref:Uncharacterized protein n=1 Tax=Human betaherpesvirus 6 TaxID=10368 RepID=A0A5P9S5Z3_9BETA|nr:hypothetical protein [Human betaherpesvirus 6]QFV21881.1 hypothetical protein [Human betaherpesvirus 6]QFV22702.1 hypothetical protein [Human betaherpesvirus 6]QFV24866.1 hypothetical protein [Human betaherpesvirus 6]QFW06171.1 hypothetical protein [Human betaherpesvirus 6]
MLSLCVCVCCVCVLCLCVVFVCCVCVLCLCVVFVCVREKEIERDRYMGGGEYINIVILNLCFQNWELCVASHFQSDFS